MSVEFAAGEAALKAYVSGMLAQEGKSWEAWFIPESAYQTGAADVIKAADAAKDQSDHGRQAAGAHALRIALNTTGQGGQVTDAQVASGTAVILHAIARVRAAHHHA